MRDQFPIFQKHPSLIYLDSAATSHKPKCVIDALTTFYAEEYGTVHRAIYQSALIATDRYNDTRETVRKFIHASSAEEIVFTRGTTDALNLVALSWARTQLKPGDEILVSEMEHHSNLVPWQMAAQATGATLKIFTGFPPITGSTKLIAIAHMTNVTGSINPIADIAKEAHRVGAILVVDGAQAAPHLPIDVQALGCDFYAFSSHKCYGPTGLGILYGRKELLESMPPVIGGGDMIDRVDLYRSTYAKPPLRFEAGTPIIGSVVAFKAALDFIEQIGRKKMAAHENALRLHLEQGLATIEGMQILGNDLDKGPLTTFAIKGVHSLDIATFLDLKHIAIRSGNLCAQPALRTFGLETAARVSFGIYNTLEEVDFFLKELKKTIDRLRSC
jgi:cysteine desulfurase/selenocysteine lyase